MVNVALTDCSSNSKNVGESSSDQCAATMETVSGKPDVTEAADHHLPVPLSAT